MSFISCNHKHTTIFFKNKHKIIYKQEQCDEYGSFPQMIVIPYFEKATQVVPNCNTYPVNKTAFAMIIFYHQWLEYFEDNNMAVRGMLENVMIEWGVEKKIEDASLFTLALFGLRRSRRLRLSLPSAIPGTRPKDNNMR